MPTRSADVEALATAMVRGAFEYQGQKCSAASRAYIPSSIWPKVKELALGQTAEIKMGPPTDFRNFFNAVIDAGAFSDITAYIQYAKESADAEILCGGDWDDSEGYYIQPTMIQTTDPRFKLMEEEIFGPVLDDLRLRRQGFRRHPRSLRHHLPLRSHRRDLRPRPDNDHQDGRPLCATLPATSTSTTNPPAPWSVSSPSAAPAPPAPTTRRAPIST